MRVSLRLRLGVVAGTMDQVQMKRGIRIVMLYTLKLMTTFNLLFYKNRYSYSNAVDWT